MVVKSKTSLMKAMLCARGGEITNESEYDKSAPTASRVSLEMTFLISIIMNWEVGIVDVSQAFLQASLIDPPRRTIVLPPWSIPPPWMGEADTTLERYRYSEFGFLTLGPHIWH